MPLRRASTILFVVLIAGCRGGPKASGSGVDSAGTRSGAVAGAGDTAARAARWQRETSGDCGLVPVTAHGNAGELVEEYMQRSGAGMLVTRTAWLDTAYECPRRLSVPREIAVVGGSTITPFSRTDTAVEFLVESPELGVLVLGAGPGGRARYTARGGTVADTFVVARTPYGWRIVSPPVPERVVGTTVLADAAHFRLSAADRATLVHGIAAGAETPGAQPQGP